MEEAAAFLVEPLRLNQSKHWQIVDGAIVHDSGRFFRIAGTAWREAEGTTTYRPMIDQWEIGTLGFVVRTPPSGVPELLAQAKIEPGNVNAVQIGPTCQATASNLACAHGGDSPPYSAIFSADADVLHQSLQSEQGSRFLGKRNRNVLIRSDGDVALSPAHRFLPVDEVLELLTADYVLNTDTRSVLTTSPWQALIQRPPFHRHRDLFSRELAASFEVPTNTGDGVNVKAALARVRAQTSPATIVPLEALEGWRLDAEGIVSESGGPYRIRQIQVRARGREVAEWDQPIMDSAGSGLVELHCGREHGILHFLFRPQVERGLLSAVELGPTVCLEPGSGVAREPVSPSARTIVETWQSDEGGRFYCDTSLYRLVDLGERSDAADGHWLTLAQIHELLLQGGWFTNEARSALSLLLKWL